ncbi:MAG: ribonuclease PH [Candidatus Latescibacteria bacterium]|nr:ribonuclease PH [bacterium]MBD3424355.1 ribonuclease PH [Candidatus Latescibacterota bacterium]
MVRSDGRKRRDQIREIKFRRKFIKSADSSVLASMGNTRVLCVATVEERVPKFLRGTGSGWITAQYAMLPRSSPSRIPRESRRGHLKGRTQEIQRLIGRSLRQAVDLTAIGERTILIDCDVIEADGGTRTAAVNGGFVALYSALKKLKLAESSVVSMIAAVSLGLIKGKVHLDLDYTEDFAADADINVVMDEKGGIVEIQGTAEEAPFSEEQLGAVIKSARRGIRKIIKAQKKALKIE